jgi:hypothetical protein
LLYQLRALSSNRLPITAVNILQEKRLKFCITFIFKQINRYLSCLYHNGKDRKIFPPPPPMTHTCTHKLSTQYSYLTVQHKTDASQNSTITHLQCHKTVPAAEQNCHKTVLLRNSTIVECVPSRSAQLVFSFRAPVSLYIYNKERKARTEMPGQDRQTGQADRTDRPG